MEQAARGAAAAKAMLSTTRATKDAALRLATARLRENSAAVFAANGPPRPEAVPAEEATGWLPDPMA